MSDAIQYSLSGRTVRDIVESAEQGIRNGRLIPGQQLDSVRQAAQMLEVSPNTVAAAYRVLRQRGLVVTHDRSRTVVSRRPPLAPRPRMSVPMPPSVRDLSSGNPDPELLPSLERALEGLELPLRLYGEPSTVRDLVDFAAEQLASSGVPNDHVAVVNGGLDGIERVLSAHLAPGQKVAVEDPSYTGVLDLLRAMNHQLLPVAVDEFGPRADALETALAAGASAFIVTPRNQNPTGAALDQKRACDLRDVLGRFGDVLVIEDDHASGTTPLPRIDLLEGRANWALVQSFAKALGPDLRLAVLAGDSLTVGRVEGRQMLGCGWVSEILQRLVLRLLTDTATQASLGRAAETYDRRRESLLAALSSRGITASGRSGFNVWIPVPEEEHVVLSLLHLGWAVRGGEAYRLASAPGIRVTTTRISVEEAEAFATDLDRVLHPPVRTRAA